METIEIKKGWYWSAGGKYGWKDQYDPKGVGLSRDILINNEEIRVKVNDEYYLVNCQEAREFVRQWKSDITMPGGTRIGIVSKSLLTKLHV